MIYRFSLFSLCLFLFYQYVFAGGIYIYPDTFVVNNSKQPYIASIEEDFRLEFMADQYIYGRPGDKGYIIFILDRVDICNKKSSLNDNERLLFITPLKTGESEIMYRIRTSTKLKEFLKEGKYCIKYSRFPIFESDLVNFSSPRPWYDELVQIKNPRILTNISNFSKRLSSEADLGTINFVGSEIERVALYLRVNDELPVSVKGPLNFKLISEKPIKFSWFPKYKGVVVKEELFRYRLLPDQNWSPWNSERKKEYYYLSIGNHIFEVEGKYIDKNDKQVTIPPIKFNFNLAQPFVSKAESGYSINKNKIMYKNRYALLIGVEDFKAKEFSKLPYIQNDIKLIRDSLKRHNFQIEQKIGNLSEKKIIDILNRTVKKLKEDDLLVIYISSHGFNKGSDAYLATSNCVKETANGCIHLKRLGQIVDESNHKGRHILVFLDLC